MHVGSEFGIDEFGSEDVRRPEAAKRRAWLLDAFAEGAVVPLLAGIAIIEAVALFAIGIYLSGILVAPTGTLVLESQPPGARVLVDGKRMGTTPVQLRVVEGDHAVELHLGDHTRGMALRVERDQTTRARVDVVLPPSPVVASGAQVVGTKSAKVAPPQAEGARPTEPSGWLELPSRPVLQVYEHGRPISGTDSGRIALPAGAHALQLVNDELGIRIQQQVTVRPGATVLANPEIPPGTVSINADPWANVWMNGEPVGQTLISGLSRPAGFHDVLLRNPTLGERRAQVKVTAHESVRLNVNMRRPAEP